VDFGEIRTVVWFCTEPASFASYRQRLVPFIALDRIRYFAFLMDYIVHQAWT